MIPDLHISKLESSLYEARLSDGGIEISGPTLHATIAEALEFVGRDVPEDFAHFVDVHYGGGSIGTTAIVRLVVDAPTIADRLVAIAAAVYQSEEEMQYRATVARTA